MRAFRIYVTILMFCLYGIISAQEIIYNNGDTFARRLVADYQKSYKEFLSADSIIQLLVDNGYFDCMASEVKNQPEAQIIIDVNRQYYINNILIQNNKIDTIICHCRFDKNVINYLIDSLILSHQEKGNYFVSISPDIYKSSENSVDIQLEVNSGPIVMVSDINYVGIEKTRNSLLDKYMATAPGDTLKRSFLDRTVQNLSRLDYISLDNSPVIIPDAGYRTAGIHFQFTEKKQFYFEGSGGYIPDDNGYFVWYLNFNGRNIFGGGEKAGIIADRREKNRSVFSSYYGQPIFLIGIGEALLHFHTRDFREQFYEFGMDFDYTINLRRNISVTSSLGWKNVELADSLNRSFAVYKAGLGLHVGNIKNVRRKSGLALDWKISYLNRQYKNQSHSDTLKKSVYNDTKNELQVELLYPLFSFLSNFNKLSFKDIESSEKPLPPSELFYLGGPLSLRGYRNDQFVARRIALLNSELHLFLSSNDYFYPFFDIAYYERDQFNSEAELDFIDEAKYGYGIGLSLFSDRRHFKIELSWGEDTAFDEPRVNIKVESEF